MKTLLITASLLAAALCACASKPPQPQPPLSAAEAYTDQQKVMLSLCILPTTLIRGIADDKLAGVSEQAAAQRWAKNPAQEQMVSQVYSDSFTDPWSYLTARYDECAAKIKVVPASELGPANRCMLQAMIADKAIIQRMWGRSKDSTYQSLPQPDDAVARGIVDRIYALPEVTDQGEAMDTWLNCMGLPRGEK